MAYARCAACGCVRDGTLPISEQKLIGKTGVVEYIGGLGELHGTWGGIAILPEDKYEVIP